MECVRFPASQLPLYRGVRDKGGSGLGAKEDEFSNLMGLGNDTRHQVSLYSKPENRQAAKELPKDFSEWYERHLLVGLHPAKLSPSGLA